MDTFEAITRRRAVKHFDPDHRLTPAEETRLLEAAIQAHAEGLVKHISISCHTDP